MRKLQRVLTRLLATMELNGDIVVDGLTISPSNNVIALFVPHYYHHDPSYCKIEDTISGIHLQVKNVAGDVLCDTVFLFDDYLSETSLQVNNGRPVMSIAVNSSTHSPWFYKEPSFKCMMEFSSHIEALIQKFKVECEILS